MKRLLSLPKRSILIILLSAIMMIFSACSADEAKRNNEYFDKLDSLSDTLVMKSRELNSARDAWDFKDKKSTEEYIAKISEVEKAYSDIRQIPSTKSYEDTDKSIKENCDLALSALAGYKSAAQNAYDTKDDTIYTQNSAKYYEDYNTAYEDILSSVSYIRTANKKS